MGALASVSASTQSSPVTRICLVSWSGWEKYAEWLASIVSTRSQGVAWYMRFWAPQETARSWVNSM